MIIDNDRFGISEKTIVRLSQDPNWLFRDGNYVPTRNEVKTLPLRQLSNIIISWMWESPSELIPNNEQIESVIQILNSRHDSNTSECMNLLVECKRYIGTAK